MCSDCTDGERAEAEAAEQRDRQEAELEEARAAQRSAAAEHHPWAYDETPAYYGTPR